MKLKLHKWNIMVLIFSCMLQYYSLTVILPFADRHGFFNENTFPEQAYLFSYFLMVAPIYALYFIFIFSSFKKISFLKSINYPIIILNSFLGVFFCLLTMGAGILWAGMLLIPIVFIALIAALVIGVREDIKYIKSHRNKIEQ